ncbi:MAG: hypothetical protein ABIA78_00935 [archaeon]
MIKKIISKLKKYWQEEDPVIKRLTYFLIAFIPLGMIFTKQIDKIIEFISIRFGASMDSSKIWPLSAPAIFLTLLIITLGIISYLVELIKNNYRK